MVKKNVGKHKVPRMIDIASYKRKFVKEMKIWLTSQPRWKL